MAQSDARFGYRAKLKREDHDLSRSFGFTCAPGMLLPIFADIATPGDTYYIHHDLTFLRTLPLAQPAMVDVKVHYETFFIPFQMIYQPAENTIFSLKNLQSSFYNLSTLINNNFPLWDYQDFITNIMTNYQRKQEHQDAFRLADMLDLNADAFAYDSTNPSRYDYAPNHFPWALLAYHTIYEYYYRLDDKSQFSQMQCNADVYYNNTVAFSKGAPFMEIHQRPWNFDYFTSLYRSPIVSDANMQNLSSADALARLGISELEPNQGFARGRISKTNNTTTPDLSSPNVDIYSLSPYRNEGNPAADTIDFMAGKISTATIRQMFANEKLAMISGRARKTYDAQVLAHFGVEVPHDVKHDLTRIAWDEYPIHIGEVTSLAEGTNTSLGDLAGKGWAQSPKDTQKHKFTAPCHGIVMTIFSIEPLQRYYGGFGRINALTDAFDIPTPEFDRLGNQPMFRYEAGSKTTGMSDTDIIGWKERFYWNKRRSPKTTLAFSAPSQYPGRGGLSNSYAAFMIATQPFGNELRNPNVGRPDLEARYYISRNCMDSLMLVNYYDGWYDGTGSTGEENWNATPWLAYARDPFIVDSFEKVKKVSWMSKDGEPVYDI